MLTIVVPWRDREELRQAIPGLIQSVAPLGGEVVVVNFSGNNESLLRQLPENVDCLTIASVEGEKFFNKSAAQNIGASVAKNDILFFCDCDILVCPKEVKILAKTLDQHNEIFATIAGVRETKVNSRKAKHVTKFGYVLHIQTADGRELEIVDNEEDGKNGTRQAPGLLFVKKKDFAAINGYNSTLEGWGWEDQDIISRLTLGRGLKRIQQGYFTHVSHDDDARMAHYPHFASRWESRDRMFRKALENYNNNCFSGTFDGDISRLAPKLYLFPPIKAKKIPQKQR